MNGELIPTGVTFGAGRNSINYAFSGTAAFNNIELDSGANFSGGTGGGVILSGGTDLYNIFGTGGSGEANTASNIGAGEDIFKQKSGVNLEFRRISAGTNVQIVAGDTITINGGGGAVYDYGSVSGSHNWDITGDGANAKLTFSGDITSLNVLNATPGTYGTLELQQSSGGNTIALGAGANKVANGGGGTITLTATASAVDIISFFYDGSTFFWTVGNNYT